MTHSLKELYKDERMPDSEQMFDDTLELVCVPDISILSVAEDLRRSIRPPELVETEGLKRVKSDRNVYVDPTDRKFRKSTGDLAPGYADLV